jgi:transposase
MSDEEWQVTEPALPAPAWQAGQGGRPAQHCRRDIVDAIRYLVKDGIQWRAPYLPISHQTVYDVLHGWQQPGSASQTCLAQPRQG